MSALLIAAVLAAAPIESVGDSPALEAPGILAEQPVVPFRTGRELRQAARESLRQWARPEDHELEAAAKDLLAIFRELEADTELAISLREPLIRQVRGRLDELARRLRVQAAVRRRLAREQQEEAVDAVGDRQPMAQFGGFGGGMGVQQGMGMGMQQGMGMGGQGQDDHGEQLVDLIQTTIRPNTWDRVGGPGSIYYWRSQRAIVVRQMGDVHDEIGDVLQQLNRAGR